MHLHLCMIRSLTAYLLIANLLLTQSTRFVIYAGFKLNQGYIASVLCENRDKPVLKCEGKCYLSKKLKQADEKEKSQERESQKKHLQDAFIQDKALVNFPLKLIEVLSTPVLESPQPLHLPAPFHPPQNSLIS